MGEPISMSLSSEPWLREARFHCRSRGIASDDARVQDVVAATIAPLLAELAAERATIARVRAQADLWIADYWPDSLRIGRMIRELLGDAP